MHINEQYSIDYQTLNWYLHNSKGVSDAPGVVGLQPPALNFTQPLYGQTSRHSDDHLEAGMRK
jgi:hypothetical protein